MPRLVLHNGDCVEVLKGYADGSIGAIVSDPPYGLEFMGKDWDRLSPGTPQESTGDVFHDPSVVGGFQDGAGGNPFSRSRIRYGRGQSMREWHRAWVTEAFRVLCPGGVIKAFSGSRTFHHLAYAVEQAGFTDVELEAWTYGSGFPKSLDVSKAIDKTNGEAGRLHRFTAWMRTTGLTARQINDATGTSMGSHYLNAGQQPAIPTPALWAVLRPLCGDIPPWVDALVDRIEAERETIGVRSGFKAVSGVAYGGDGGWASKEIPITAPATDAAKAWEGWGTALKPAWEPVVTGRRPL